MRMYVYLGDTGIKLLGVVPLPHKSSESAGELISTGTVNLLNKWECAEDIVAMVFDTTSTNTGNPQSSFLDSVVMK